MNRYKYNTSENANKRGDCPKCGHEQTCPCKNCATNNVGKKNWIWTTDGEGIICAGCGFTASADFWSDREMEYAYSRGLL